VDFKVVRHATQEGGRSWRGSNRERKKERKKEGRKEGRFGDGLIDTFRTIELLCDVNTVAYKE